MRSQIKPPIIKNDFVQFFGGLDTEASQLNASPGTFITCVNYEPQPLGGIKRIDGCERFDGRFSPHLATYLYCDITKTGTIAINDTVTGAISGATAVVIDIQQISGSNYYLLLTDSTGTFQAENITITSVGVGTINVDPNGNGFSTAKDDQAALLIAQNYYRNKITAVPGSGKVLGVCKLKGVVYAFRNNAGGTATELYKSTASGWSKVTLYQQISFNTGLEEIPDGTTITQPSTGATAIVKRQILETSTYLSGTATGRLIIQVTSGTFNASGVLQVGGVTKATSASLATQITLSPNGRYDFVVHNFTGSIDTLRMYGCDGVNHAFEFDGSVYCPINTNQSVDAPSYISAHQGMLFLAFKGSTKNSGKGYPFQWTATTGALEIPLGDNVTGYARVTGKTLLEFTRHQIYQLNGTSVIDFEQDLITPNIGAIPFSIQSSSSPYLMSNRGVVNITNTLNYGNFNNETVSRKIQKVIDANVDKVIASAVYKARNQIRWYFNDGTGIICTIADGINGKEHHFSTFVYPFNVTCVYSGEDNDNSTTVFFGDDNGFVYQADVGPSFDGQEIEAYALTHFTNSKSPSVIKKYRDCWLDISNNGYSEILVNPNFGYGDASIAQHYTNSLAIQPMGGLWDVSDWDKVYYDGRRSNRTKLFVRGTAVNMALAIYSKSATDPGHTINTILITYTPLRLDR